MLLVLAILLYSFYGSEEACKVYEKRLLDTHTPLGSVIPSDERNR